jgi:hypothetical protein
MHNMAHYGFSPEGRDILMRAFPRAPTRESMSGRAILEGAVVQSEDMSTDEGTALSHQLSRVLGSHAYLSVPMLREVCRSAPSPWPAASGDRSRPGRSSYST